MNLKRFSANGKRKKGKTNKNTRPNRYAIAEDSPGTSSSHIVGLFSDTVSDSGYSRVLNYIVTQSEAQRWSPLLSYPFLVLGFVCVSKARCVLWACMASLFLKPRGHFSYFCFVFTHYSLSSWVQIFPIANIILLDSVCSKKTQLHIVQQLQLIFTTSKIAAGTADHPIDHNESQLREYILYARTSILVRLLEIIQHSFPPPILPIFPHMLLPRP
jgi:hypothetical protein